MATAGPGRQNRQQELWVDLVLLLFGLFLPSGVWGTQTVGYLYSCSCAIRGAATPGRSAPRPLGYTHVAQTIFQIKTSSYRAGRLLYSSPSEPGPPQT